MNKCKLIHAIALYRAVQQKVREHGLSPRTLEVPRWYVGQCVKAARLS